MNAMKLHLQQLKMMKILFSLDESLIYVKTRLPFATTSIHISTPELTDKTKNMSTGQNLNGEKTIPIVQLKKRPNQLPKHQLQIIMKTGPVWIRWRTIPTS